MGRNFINKNLRKDFKAFEEHHTNRVLISTILSVLSLLVLAIVHNGQSNTATALFTRSAVFTLSIVFAIIGIVMAIIAAKRDKSLFEYAAYFIVMAISYYLLHGVGIVTIKTMKYVVIFLVIVYLASSITAHFAIIRNRKNSIISKF